MISLHGNAKTRKLPSHERLTKEHNWSLFIFTKDHHHSLTQLHTIVTKKQGGPDGTLQPWWLVPPEDSFQNDISRIKGLSALCVCERGSAMCNIPHLRNGWHLAVGRKWPSATVNAISFLVNAPSADFLSPNFSNAALAFCCHRWRTEDNVAALRSKHCVQGRGGQKWNNDSCNVQNWWCCCCCQWLQCFQVLLKWSANRKITNNNTSNGKHLWLPNQWCKSPTVAGATLSFFGQSRSVRHNLFASRLQN